MTIKERRNKRCSNTFDFENIINIITNHIDNKTDKGGGCKVQSHKSSSQLMINPFILYLSLAFGLPSAYKQLFKNASQKIYMILSKNFHILSHSYNIILTG